MKETRTRLREPGSLFCHSLLTGRPTGMDDALLR